METVTTIALIILTVFFGLIFIGCAIYGVVFLIKRHDAKVARRARIELYKALIRDKDIIYTGNCGRYPWDDDKDFSELNSKHSGRYPWGDNKED